MAKGTSEIQKSMQRLAHSTVPLTRSVTCNMWWWLFQKIPTFAKLSAYTKNTVRRAASEEKSDPEGTVSSNTMMVITMAITPSVKASRRPLPISFLCRCYQIRLRSRGRDADYMTSGLWYTSDGRFGCRRFSRMAIQDISALDQINEQSRLAY